MTIDLEALEVWAAPRSDHASELVSALRKCREALSEAAEWLESRPDYTEGDAATSSSIRQTLAEVFGTEETA
mgnify:CR=1 FL=1